MVLTAEGNEVTADVRGTGLLGFYMVDLYASPGTARNLTGFGGVAHVINGPLGTEYLRFWKLRHRESILLVGTSHFLLENQHVLRFQISYVVEERRLCVEVEDHRGSTVGWVLFLAILLS
jgi:hypothetical protein